MASTLAVPTIDMSRWTCGSRESRAALAVAFDTAASTVGFVQLVNHSIPAGALAGLLSAADAFFALPAEEKALASPRSTSTNRGYSPPRSESLSLSLSEATAGAAPPPPDSFEAFNVGPDDVDEADPFYAAERHRFFAPNVWPARPAGFRDAATAYFAAAHGVALALVDIFAPALRLPDGYFGRLVDRSTTTMRVINYEPSADGGACEAGAGETGGQRMGAHTDYGMVTVLYADAVPGLQVCCDGGVWRDVMPEPGALLVNFGDMMAEATNDRWKST
jgi:isopenicillin N synthase-like dioxygenase